MGKHLISYRLSTTYLVFRRLDQVWSGITNLCFWWFRQSQVSFMVRSFWVPVVCPDWCARFTMTFLEVDTCKETQKQTSKVVFPSSQHFYAFLMKNISPETNWNRCSLFQLGMHASPPYSSRTPPPSQAVPYARALEASPWLPCENGFGGETRRASLGWLKWFEIVILGRNPNLKYPKQTQLIFSGTCWMIPIKKWIESSPWTYFWVSCHFF